MNAINSFTTNNELPNCSYFSIFDGHGGNKCANFLREKLHQYILNDPKFPNNVDQAIKNGVLKAEREFLTKTR